MGKFEDDIKKKLQEGEMDYNPSHWTQLSSALSAAPSFSLFEQKIQDTFNEAEINGTPNWDEFSNNLNSLDPFEKNLKEKLNTGESQMPQNSWDDFSEKLANSKLNQFEKGIKDVMSTGKVEYNLAHWKAFEKLLNGNSTKKFILRSAAAVLLLLGTVYASYKLLPDANLKSEKETTIKQIEDQKELKLKSELNKASNPTGNNLTTPVLKDGQKTGLEYSEQKGVSKNNLKSRHNNFKQNNFHQNIIFDDPNDDSKSYLSPRNQTKENNELTGESKKATKGKNIFRIDKKVELCSNLDLINAILKPRKKEKLTYQIHPGAALWVNIWSNPAVTGLYGKNNLSGYYLNNWEFVDENKDQQGEFNLTQPLVYLGAYEKRLKNGFAVGGSYKYELKTNWNNRELTGYFSYAKTIFNELEVRIGGASSYRNNNLAVDRLTLRERFENSENIVEEELGTLKSKQHYSITNHIGTFINHKNFYLGYTLFNGFSKTITNKNDVILLKHCAMAGAHSPQLYKFNASALFKFEKELFKTYTPGLGITYDNKLFITAEYENFVRPKLSLGYNLNRKIRAHATFAYQDLTDLQRELNLDNFVDRQGYIYTGINWNF